MEKRESLKRKPHFGGAIGGSVICCCWGFWSEEEGCVVGEMSLFRVPIVVFCVTLTVVVIIQTDPSAKYMNMN